MIPSEATKGASEEGTVGSIAGGGRYDNLVGMFNPTAKTPCVGVSIGVERIFSLIEAKNTIEGKKAHTSEVQVFVASPHKGVHEQRLKIVSDLWNAGIRSEHSYKQNPKLLTQLQHCEAERIPWAVIIGGSELERGVAIVREIETRVEEEITLDSLAEELLRRLNHPKSS